jgi:hypothetical protein
VSVPYTPEPQQLRAPEGTAPSTVQFWLIVVLSAVMCVPGMFYLASFDMSDMLRQSMSNPTDPFAVYGFVFTPAYLATLAAAFIGYGATVWLAYLDSRALIARGVPKPFPWATSFIPTYGTYVYVIGRSVVVRRRTGTGLAPLWVFVALQVVVFIISSALAFAMMAAMFSSINDLVSLYP